MEPFTFAGKTLYGHTGGVDNFGAWLAYEPEERVALAYTSNAKVYPVKDIVSGVADIITVSRFRFPRSKRSPSPRRFWTNMSEFIQFPAPPQRSRSLGTERLCFFNRRARNPFHSKRPPWTNSRSITARPPASSSSSMQ